MRVLVLGVLAAAMAVAAGAPAACPDAPSPPLAVGAPCHHAELNVTGECRSTWSCPYVRRQKASDRRYCAQLCRPQGVCCPGQPPPPAWREAHREPPPCVGGRVPGSPRADDLLAWTDKLRAAPCTIPEEEIAIPRVSANASIIERKCLAYQLLEFMDEDDAALTVGDDVYCKRYCANDEGVPFVVGGEDAGDYEFPHMALLLDDKDEPYCAGTLISEDFVLTAAHCAVPARVLLGLVRTNERDNGNVKVARVAKHIVHPDFFRSGGAHSDIALLQLQEPVRFTVYVRPACLHTGDDARLQEAVVTGWGYQEYDSGSGVKEKDKKTSEALQKAAVDIFSREHCLEMWGDDSHHVHEKHICALGKKKKGVRPDACQGDSGGPLQVSTAGGPGTCSYLVAAVVSQGRGCGTDRPGLYTSVSRFTDWIQRWVWPCEV